MRPILFVALVACGLVWTTGALAQNVSGVGQQASEVFTLQEGLATWDLEHQGEGEFLVRLLDPEGNVVEQLARATGPTRVSRAVRIPRTGQYLYDVSATGAWSIQLRTRSVVETTPGAFEEAFRAGRQAGEEAARARGGGMWFGAGFLGGATLGPVGTGLAMVVSGRPADLPADDPRLQGQHPRYIEGFQEGYRDRLVASRRGSALIGGIVGTTLLTILLLQYITGEGTSPPANGGTGPGGPV